MDSLGMPAILFGQILRPSVTMPIGLQTTTDLGGESFVMLTKIISAAIVVALSCVAYAEGYVENVALYNEDDGLVTVCYDLVSEKPKRIDLVGTASGFDLEFAKAQIRQMKKMVRVIRVLLNWREDKVNARKTGFE